MLLVIDQNHPIFCTDYMFGKVTIDDIDDYVHLWHRSKNDEPLYLYLGLSREEYALFLEDTSAFEKWMDIKKRSLNGEL